MLVAINKSFIQTLVDTLITVELYNSCTVYDHNIERKNCRNT